MLLKSIQEFDNFLEGAFRSNGIYYLANNHIFLCNSEVVAKACLQRALTKYKIIQEISIDYYAGIPHQLQLERPADYAMYAFSPKDSLAIAPSDFSTKKSVLTSHVIKCAKNNNNGLLIFTDSDMKSIFYDDNFAVGRSIFDYTIITCTISANVPRVDYSYTKDGLYSCEKKYQYA